ncbi:MAG: beta-ketoacyl-ACP synthase II [Caldithrix sp.]|nr:beta-ketoacyl-ACP synthase II [Caldithrix sp.]
MSNLIPNAAQSKKKRVVITGLGVVSPIGTGMDRFWDRLTKGANGVSRITRFDPTEYRSQMAAEVKDFEARDWLDKKTIARFDRFNHYAIAAADQALNDSGLTEYKFDQTRAGVIIGSGIGGADSIQEGIKALSSQGPKSVSPFFISKVIINMSASLVSIRHGLKGPLAAPSVACSTGGNAIGEAMLMIKRSDADFLVAGSAEAAVSPMPFAGFCASRSMSARNHDLQKASRPFDKDRDGFVMGEGSGIVIVEELQHALKRGAHIYAEIIGYGNTADAFHFTAPDPEAGGMVRVMRNAFKDAEIDPSEVQYINAHGTSTELNDKTECLAIQKVFDGYGHNLKISSIKSMIGHLLSAAGSVEFISTVKTIETGIMPPTINLENKDPLCPLHIIANQAEQSSIHTAITNNFGFGGGNACLVIRRFEP